MVLLYIVVNYQTIVNIAYSCKFMWSECVYIDDQLVTCDTFQLFWAFCIKGFILLWLFDWWIMSRCFWIADPILLVHDILDWLVEILFMMRLISDGLHFFVAIPPGREWMWNLSDGHLCIVTLYGWVLTLPFDSE